jgi:anti-anti-sigma factor
VILKAAKQTRAAGGDLAIYGMREKVREVFEMSGFLSILTVRDDRQAAVSALGA